MTIIWDRNWVCYNFFIIIRRDSKYHYSFAFNWFSNECNNISVNLEISNEIILIFCQLCIRFLDSSCKGCFWKWWIPRRSYGFCYFSLNFNSRHPDSTRRHVSDDDSPSEYKAGRVEGFLCVHWSGFFISYVISVRVDELAWDMLGTLFFYFIHFLWWCGLVMQVKSFHSWVSSRHGLLALTSLCV